MSGNLGDTGEPRWPGVEAGRDAAVAGRDLTINYFGSEKSQAGSGSSGVAFTSAEEAAWNIAANSDDPGRMDLYDVDVVLEARLCLSGTAGHSGHISESVRGQLLAALNDETSQTVQGSIARLVERLHVQSPEENGHLAGWRTEGRSTAREMTARLSGPEVAGRTLATATFSVELVSGAGDRDCLIIKLRVALTNPARQRPPSRSPNLDSLPPGASPDEVQNAILEDILHGGSRSPELPGPMPKYIPFIDFSDLSSLLRAILATVWGSPEQVASRGVLGPTDATSSLLGITIFSVHFDEYQISEFDDQIDFGMAQRIPGSTPVTRTEYGPFRLNYTARHPFVRDEIIRPMLIRFGLDNGYQDVEKEVQRHLPRQEGQDA